jgi:hypothetical protein
MPYVFEFDYEDAKGHEHEYKANVHSARCVWDEGTTHRCKNRVAIGAPYCWVHLKYRKELVVKTSPGKGKGVFAFKKEDDREPVFHDGELVCAYGGQNVSVPELNRRYGKHTGPYALGGSFGEGRYTVQHHEDGALDRGIGTLLNHPNRGERSNCEFEYDEAINKYKVYAIRDIYKGEELLVHYGKKYRFNEAGTEYSTKYKAKGVPEPPLRENHPVYNLRARVTR